MSKQPQLGLFPSSENPESLPHGDTAQSGATDAAGKVRESSQSPIRAIKSEASKKVEVRRDAEIAVSSRPQIEERYLSVQEVARRYSISIQTVWRHTKHNPDFPKPIKILNGSTRWRLSQILAFETLRNEVGQ